MEVRAYPSSINDDLILSAEFYIPNVPKPLCLFFHGWHNDAARSAEAGYIDELKSDFFVISMDMRGRGGSTMKPDASGLELIDALDTVEFAGKTWPASIPEKSGVFSIGGSGGGGNVLAVAGKAPDFFCSAVSWAGMSDYGLWYEGDSLEHYRDEMKGKSWIGGTPKSNPEGYRSRGGLYVVENVIIPLLVIHGKNDRAVPVLSAEKYEAAANKLGKKNIHIHYNDGDHGSSVDWPLMLRFIKEHTIQVNIPRRGMLRVNSFLACRPFRLVFDHPSGMAEIEYLLDDHDRLSSLRFVPLNKRISPGDITLRVYSPVEGLTVETANEILSLKKLNQDETFSDYRWSPKHRSEIKIGY